MGDGERLLGAASGGGSRLSVEPFSVLQIWLCLAALSRSTVVALMSALSTLATVAVGTDGGVWLTGAGVAAAVFGSAAAVLGGPAGGG